MFTPTRNLQRSIDPNRDPEDATTRCVRFIPEGVFREIHLKCRIIATVSVNKLTQPKEGMIMMVVAVVDGLSASRNVPHHLRMTIGGELIC